MSLESSKGNRVIIGGAFAASIIIFLVWFFASGNSAKPLWQMPASLEESKKAYAYIPPPESTLIKFTEGVNAWYVNEALGFSFRLPDGFSAPDGKLQGSETHVVELSNGAGNELHIIARKITVGADTRLSEEIIRTQTPEENLSAFQEVVLPDGTPGFIFETDSAEWGGSGLAFWFIKDGYLFSLTSAKKDAELLDAVMKTWNFGRPIAPPPPQN